MKTGVLGFELIKKSEVFIPYVYDDRDKQWPRRRVSWNGSAWAYHGGTRIFGMPTFGYGFIARSPADCPRDMTEPEAAAKLATRLGEYEAAVNRGWAQSFGDAVEMTQNMFDALASAAWNLGQGAVQKLIASLSRVSLADADAVKAVFVAWDKWNVNGALVENAGLKLRRLKEAALFLRPVEPAIGPSDVTKILESVHETSMTDIAKFLDGGGPIPTDDDVPPTDRNS